MGYNVDNNNYVNYVNYDYYYHYNYNFYHHHHYHHIYYYDKHINYHYHYHNYHNIYIYYRNNDSIEHNNCLSSLINVIFHDSLDDLVDNNEADCGPRPSHA